MEQHNLELAMVDDVIVPIEQAKISAQDRCVYFGDGVYEVVRLCGGRLFALDRHLARLKSSLEKMDMLDRVDLEVIRQRVERAVAEAKMTEAQIYFQVSRGIAPRSHNYPEDWQSSFLLTIRPSREAKTQGRAITHPDWRWKRCDIKSLNLLANVLAKQAAVRAGAYEALLVDENGLVTEATSSSVLIVRDGLLRTAPLWANILPGITRALLLEWAGAVGLTVREESFTVDQAHRAEELIITGTGTEVMSITHLDGVPVGDGQPGRYADRLNRLLTDAMRSEGCQNI